MTALGRSAPGEAWRRAMREVADRIAAGAVRRYRVYGRRIDDRWWTYEVGSVREPRKPPEPMTRDRVAELSKALPRCAQRARQRNGGNSKVAWPSRTLADEVAEFLGAKAYRCTLPAPAIGEHWHVTTGGKRRRKW